MCLRISFHRFPHSQDWIEHHNTLRVGFIKINLTSAPFSKDTTGTLDTLFQRVAENVSFQPFQPMSMRVLWFYENRDFDWSRKIIPGEPGLLPPSFADFGGQADIEAGDLSAIGPATADEGRRATHWYSEVLPCNGSDRSYSGVRILAPTQWIDIRK